MHGTKMREKVGYGATKLRFCLLGRLRQDGYDFKGSIGNIAKTLFLMGKISPL